MSDAPHDTREAEDERAFIRLWHHDPEGMRHRAGGEWCLVEDVQHVLAERDAALSDLARLREEAESRERAVVQWRHDMVMWKGAVLRALVDFDHARTVKDPGLAAIETLGALRLVARDLLPPSEQPRVAPSPPFRRDAALTELARLGQEWDADPGKPPADAQLAPAAPEAAPDSQQPSTGDRETP